MSLIIDSTYDFSVDPSSYFSSVGLYNSYIFLVGEKYLVALDRDLNEVSYLLVSYDEGSISVVNDSTFYVLATVGLNKKVIKYSFDGVTITEDVVSSSNVGNGGLHYFDGYVFVGSYASNLNTIEMLNPTTLAVEDGISGYGEALDITDDGTYVYAATRTHMIAVSRSGTSISVAGNDANTWTSVGYSESTGYIVGENRNDSNNSFMSLLTFNGSTFTNVSTYNHPGTFNALSIACENDLITQYEYSSDSFKVYKIFGDTIVYADALYCDITLGFHTIEDGVIYFPGISIGLGSTDYKSLALIRYIQTPCVLTHITY